MKSVSKKVVLLGNYRVGKTSLINRFVMNTFDSNYHSTIGIKISKNTVDVNDQFSVNMVIWDLACKHQKQKLPTSYYNGAHGLIYVVDLTQTNSYIECRKDIKDLSMSFPNQPLLVIGNKIDLIPERHINPLLADTGIQFNMLCSAKTGTNVYTMFLSLAQNMVKKIAA